MSEPDPNRPAGARGFYLASAMGLAVSMNTSYHFFGERLHITGLEQWGMFAVLEVALAACAWAMRAGVQRHGSPGSARLLAWLGCAVSAYMAWDLSGLGEGIARVLLGPVLSLVMLHQALGIEIRHRTGVKSGTLARVGRELRERVLSRLGLANDERDAATRTRERAARRAARLATARHTFRRVERLKRATLAARVATDDGARSVLMAELAVLRHAGELVTLPVASPWDDRPTVAPVVLTNQGDQTDRPVTGQTDQGDRGDRPATGHGDQVTATVTDQVTARPVTMTVQASGGDRPADQVTDQADRMTDRATDQVTGHTATTRADQGGHGGHVRALPVEYDPERTDLIERATGRPVMSVTSTDQEHRDRLTEMTSDAQRVRYAVGVTGHDRPATVVEWLTDQGHPVSTEAARSTMRRMRDQGATVTTLARSVAGQG